jgi:hypothetical protein
LAEVDAASSQRNTEGYCAAAADDGVGVGVGGGVGGGGGGVFSNLCQLECFDYVCLIAIFALGKCGYIP